MRLPNFFSRIAQHHLHAFCVGWQLEPAAAGGNDLWVELNNGGLHAQHLVAKLGQRPCAQAQLQGLETGHRVGLYQQHPSKHALNVFMHQGGGVIYSHRTLNPLGFQVHVPHIAPIRKMHLGQNRSCYLSSF